MFDNNGYHLLNLCVFLDYFFVLVSAAAAAEL